VLKHDAVALAQLFRCQPASERIVDLRIGARLVQQEVAIELWPALSSHFAARRALHPSA